ncbi:MAG TPA: substrate-binding domain-containing protein, partial [Novosphingobium sp.]
HNMAEPFFVAMRRNALDEAGRLGVDLMIVDAQSNSAKQTADVETAVATGTRGVIIAPNDVNALTPAVDYVLKAGVPIATVDRKVDQASRPVPHFGADNVAGGRLMAQFVVQRFPQGAKIVLLTGSPGSSSAIDRSTGIHAVLDQAGPAYRILAEQTARWQRDQGLTVTQNILTALGGDRPDALIAEDDDMAMGAVEALRQAGIKGVTVIGFNATPEALKLVRAGEMAATVEQSPSRQIRIALDQVVANIRRGTPITGARVVPILVTAHNLADAERIGEVKP